MISPTRRRLSLTVIVAILTSLVVLSQGRKAELSTSSDDIVPGISSTMVDAIATDVDSDGRADPGDTLQYTVTIANGGTDATGVQFNDILPNSVTLASGSLAASPITTNDTYNATGNINISVPDGASDLLANDINPLTGTNVGLTVVSGNVSSTNCTGGCSNNVTLNSDGSFTYSPPAGFTGTDTFSYSATDGTATSPGTATITVTGIVWFINAAAAPGGDGRLATPFNCLTGAGCFSAANSGGANQPKDNDFIFIYSGSYTGGLTPRVGQKFIGAGASASLSVITGITTPTNSAPFPATGGAFPIVTTVAGGTNGINVASNNTLRGFNISNTTGFKIAGTGFGTLTISEMALSGSGGALSLSTGTLAAAFTSIVSTSSTTQGILLGGIAGSMTSAGGTTISGQPSQCILVGTSTGNIDFGNTSCTGGTDGVSLQNNSSGTRTFGSLTVTGASGNAFLHSVGGGNATIASASLTSAGSAISINSPGSTNVINFQGSVIANTTSAATVGVFWNGASGASLSFGSLTVQTNGGTGLNATTGGTVNVGGAGTINATTQAAPAVVANNVTLNATFASVNSSGGSNGINLVNVSGTSNFGGGALTGHSGSSVLISGGSGSATYSGTITQATAGQRPVDIQNKTAGTITLGGLITAITGSPFGILLNANTGATITLTGGMNISTGANPAFTATGGGTVNATQNNASITNVLATTTATALNVSNTNIGASGLTFRSISSSGGSSNGIILNTTGSAGGLTVVGDGSNVSVGGNASGGTIANKSGADLSFATAGTGIYLNSTSNVVLRRMTVNGTNQNYGIRGTLVSGFELSYSTVGGNNGTNFNTAPYNSGEGSIYFGDTSTNGLTGTATFLNNSISGGNWNNMSIVNTQPSGTLNLSIKGSLYGLNLANGQGNHSLVVENRGAGTINTVLGGTNAGEPNTFTGARADNVNFTGQQGSVMDVIMRNNTLSNNHLQNNIGGSSLTLASQGTMTFHVTGNSMRDANGSAVTLFKAQPLSGPAPSMTGFFDSNTIGVLSAVDSGSKTGNGIYVSAGGTGTMSYTISNNHISQIHGNAHIYADNTGGSYTANFTITGNTIDGAQPPNWFAGVAVTNGSPSSTDTVQVCAKIGGSTAGEKNTFNVGAGQLAVIVGASGAAAGHTFNLPGYAGGANLTNVQNFITSNNTITSGVTNAYTDAPVTASAFTGTGTGCSTPTSRTEPDENAFNATGGYQPIVAEGIAMNAFEPIVPASEGPSAAIEMLASAEAVPYTVKEAPAAQRGVVSEVFSKVVATIMPTVYSQERDSADKKAADPDPSTKDEGTTDQKQLSGETVTVAGGGTGFTLPAGKTVTVTFRAVINSPAQAGLTQITNQGTVSGSNFSSVLTDDPDIAGAANPTVTAVDHTTVAVTSNGNPSVFGQSVTFTATMTGVPTRASDPSGTVQFKDNGVAIGSPVAVNVGTVGDNVSTAQVSISTLTIGNHVITAEYSGGGTGILGYNPETGTLAGGQVVGQATSSTAVSSTQNPSVVGQLVTFTATVSAGGGGSGTPTGTVQFLDGGVTISGCGAVALASGSAQCGTSGLAIGNHTITAVYSGDTNFSSSNGSLGGNPQVVTKANTTVALGTSVTPSVFGQPVTFTATVSVVAPGEGTPSGTVTFRDNGVAIGTCNAQAVAAGVATCSISTLTVGSHPITAIYNGDAGLNASPVSNTVTQVVDKADTTVSIVSSANPSVLNNSVTFTATVNVTAPGAGTPTGTVQFLDGGNPIAGCTAVAISVGDAACTTTALTLGSHTITATYNGNANFNTGTGSLTGNPQVVIAAPRSRADFDGDGKTDISVFRPSDGNWYAQRSTAGFSATHWGTTGDVIVPGDYDGDGKADFAIWRPSDTANVTDFYVLNSNGFTITGYSHGLTTDIPVAGDFDGDGKADIVVWRPSTGIWYMFLSQSQTTVAEQFGQTSDIPMAMDKDGDGAANLTVYRPSDRTFYMANATGVPAQNFTSAQWGLVGDIPVPADYDGDNKEDVAVFRPSDGVWYILRSSGGTSFVQFGQSGDIPVPGDYDGDGKDDIAVYRNGNWYLSQSSAGFASQAFGLSGDTPVPAGYHP